MNLRKLQSLGGSTAVAAGILLSRVVGFLRESLFAHYFGNSQVGDVLRAAIRIPNLLQNLLGEGVLSASFVPVYGRLVAADEDRKARALAWQIFSLLAAAVCLLVLAGGLCAPYFVDLLAPGFEPGLQAATERLIPIFFMSTGILVLSAWSLGILTSQKDYFLPYAAPALWNLVVIAALWWWGATYEGEDLAWVYGVAAVVASAVQLLVQLPRALHWVRLPTWGDGFRGTGALSVTKNFVPVCVGRGVVQLSAYFDLVVASFVSAGAVSVLSFAQVLYVLPVSLFGMSVSVVELTELSRQSGQGTPSMETLAARVRGALRRILFFVVPSALAYIFIGEELIAALYQSGKFTARDSLHVWIVLAVLSAGLPAAALSRLYASVLYSAQDSRTPLRIASIRVVFAAIMGGLGVVTLKLGLGIEGLRPLVGLVLGSASGAWLEMWLLKRHCMKKFPISFTDWPFALRLTAIGLASGAAAKWAAISLPLTNRFMVCGAAIGVFGMVFLLLGFAGGSDEFKAELRRYVRA